MKFMSNVLSNAGRLRALTTEKCY